MPPGLRLFGYGAIGGVPTSPGEFEFEVQVMDGQIPPGTARKVFSLIVDGDFSSTKIDPCSEYPLFCLSINWYRQTPEITYGDLDKDGDVDEKDLLALIQSMQ